MPVFSKTEIQTFSTVAGGGYLQAYRIPLKESVQLTLVEPKLYRFGYSLWVRTLENKPKQLRWHTQPTPEDIKIAMGDEYVPSINRFTEKPDNPQPFVIMPAYVYGPGKIQVWVLSEEKVRNLLFAIDAKAGFEDLSQFVLDLGHEKNDQGHHVYTLIPIPIRPGQHEEAQNAWDEVRDSGFDLDVYFDQGNPFNPTAPVN